MIQILTYLTLFVVVAEISPWKMSFYKGSLGKDPVGQLSCSRVRRQAEANCPFCHQMRYWVLGLVPSPGKALPGEMDRCLTRPRGMIHESPPLMRSFNDCATADLMVTNSVVRVKASVISVHCLIGVSSLLCLSVRLAIAISAFRCARLPLLHQYQSTRVSGGVPTEMQLGLLSPLHLKKLFELMGTTYIKVLKPGIKDFLVADLNFINDVACILLLMGTILGFLIKLLTLSDRLINFHSMTKNQQEEKEEELLRIKDVKAGEEDAASSDKINEQRSRLTNLI
uniref:Endoplasmic reticulum transmembrane protein n=1 Tax=Brassica oleracea var. oleracea TaxID=109376 RepID=A0A0D3CIU5_BRAOL